MKATSYKIFALALAIGLLNPASMLAQTFQRVFGTAFDNSFTKVVRSGTNYYVIGRDEPTNGALSRATVTRLDNQGQHQWTLSMNIGSQWNDAVLTPGGNLLVVGNTLPFDPSSQSIMGLVTPSGAFSWLRSYNVAGRDAITRIVRNPAPNNGAFPYYALGTQWDPGGNSTWDDVVLLTMNESGNFGWKKIYSGVFGTSDDEFARDLEVLPNGDLVLSGNLDTQGAIFKADNTGTFYSAAGPEGVQFSFHDVAQTSGGFYAVGSPFPDFMAHLMKFDNDLLVTWQIALPELTAINQVWRDNNGDIYVTGRMTVGNLNRGVLLKFQDFGNSPALLWMKYLEYNDLSYNGGSSWYMPPSQIAFTDGRERISGFGGDCAFMSVSDLELSTCMSVEGFVTQLDADYQFFAPLPPNIDFYDTPVATNITQSSSLNWQQDNACATCVAAFTFQNMGGCPTFQFTNTSTGPAPLTYSWNFGDPASGASNTSMATSPSHQFSACGTYTVCLTVTGNGCTASVCQQVVVADNVPPMANCPSPIVMVQCIEHVPPPGGVTATDNCTPTASIQISVTETLSGNLPCDGTIVRRWVAQDLCGNESSCTQTIVVRDDTAPLIQCPPPITVQTNPGVCYYTGALPSATATDNCLPGPEMVCSLMTPNQPILITPQTQFPKGDNTISCFARDACGNQSQNCSFVLTVEDQEPPKITCPASTTVSGIVLADGQCKAVVNGIAPIATDNCPMLGVNWRLEGGTIGQGIGDAGGTNFMQGVTTVIYTAIDMAGNKSSCSFTVMVICPPPSNFPGFKCGQAVVSCYSQSNPNSTDEYVLGLIDVRDFQSSPVLQNWPAPMYHHPDWIRSKMGEVFGLAIDKNNDVFVTATQIYNGTGTPSAVGPAGGFAGVYKIDHTTGAVSTLVTTNANAGANTVGTKQIPNSGSGLGNICYDAGHNQFFVTNFEDGKIYRIAAPGNAGDPAGGLVLETFDPFSPDNGSTDPACLGERLFGVGFDNNRVYFGRWNQDWAIGNGPNAVFSVDISAGTGAFAGNVTPVTATSPWPTFWLGNTTMPISDIEFSSDGSKVLIAERAFQEIGTCGFHPWAHMGRVFEYLNLAGNWAAPKEFHVGNAYWYRNSAGGVDYGYSMFDPVADKVSGCDQMVWATGDGLVFDNNQRLYGLAGIPASGNGPSPDGLDYTPLNSWYIDLDGVLTTTDKRTIGDVDVFQCDCSNDEPCTCPPNAFYNLEYRTGGALNTPMTCNETIQVGGFQPFGVYGDFQCSGDACPPNPTVHWTLTGPNNFLTQGTAIAYPNFGFVIPGSTMVQQGLYELSMYAFCGLDTCVCRVYLQTNGICCQDYDGFDQLTAQGFTIVQNGCTVTVTAPQFGPCHQIDAEINWGDGTPPVSGTVPAAGATWTHTYTTTDGFVSICGTVFEEECWDKMMCNTIYVDCNSLCPGFNYSLNGSFNFGTPSGLDESIGLAQNWGGIWPSDPNFDTGDFYNTTTAPPVATPPAGTLTPPLPLSQGNFGSFWCGTQLPIASNKREGIMNQLAATLPGPNAGSSSYELSFKMACLTKPFETPALSVYGVYEAGTGTASLPFSEDFPPTWALFFPVPIVKLAEVQVQSNCDENFQNYGSFQFSNANFPATGINHIFFTRSDGWQGLVYLAFDDVCLTQIAQTICCNPDQAAFEQTLADNVTITVDSIACMVTLTTGALPACDAVIEINWGDGETTTGNFGADKTIEHTYSSSGPYTITYQAEERDTSGALCFQATRTHTVNPNCQIACPCTGIGNLTLTPGISGGSQHISCGTDIPLACKEGVNYTVSGILSCAAWCQPTSTNPRPVDWYLSGPSGAVAFGTVQAGPNFSIPLLFGYFYQTGTYTLKIVGHCPSSDCVCYVYFVVTHACCPCNVPQLNADVAKGFFALQNIGSCKVCFKPKALSPCDMVMWTIEGTGTNASYTASGGPTTGNGLFCHTFPQTGYYTVAMTVTRKFGNNQVCEVFSFFKKIYVGCGPLLPLDCVLPRAANPDFDNGSVAGTLGASGKTDNWLAVTGSPKVEKDTSGKWIMALSATPDTSDAIRTDTAICLNNDEVGTIVIRARRGECCDFGHYWVKVAFVQGDNYSGATNGTCDWGPDCYQVAEVIMDSIGPDWQDILVQYDLSSVVENDDCQPGQSLLVRPVVWVETDNPDGTTIQIDQICFQSQVATDVKGPQSPTAVAIRLFPNPTTGGLTVELPAPASAETRLRVVDAVGRAVFDQAADTGKSTQLLQVQRLPAGLYFLQVFERGLPAATARFVKE